MDLHERYLECVGYFCDDGAFCEEAEQAFADRVGQRCDEEAEGDHLCCKEKESEGVTGGR